MTPTKMAASLSRLVDLAASKSQRIQRGGCAGDKGIRWGRGAGEPGADDQTEFARVYRQVAKANAHARDSAKAGRDASDSRRAEDARDAQSFDADVGVQSDAAAQSMDAQSMEAQNTEARSPDVQSPDASATPVDARIEAMAAALTAEGLNGPDPVTADGAGSAGAQQASAIIRQSLLDISKVLHLNLGANLDDLQIRQPTAAVVEQFAEIVYTLKQIGAMLADMAAGNQSLTINGQELSPVQCAEGERLVRTGAFKIELAIQLFGVSKEVAAGVADKQQLPLNLGIPQAVDLQSASMPAAQVKEFFGGMISAKEEQVRALCAKIMAALNEQKGVAGVKIEVLAVKQGEDAQVKLSGLNAFQTPMVRKLLKIDASALENRSAAQQSDAINVAKSWQIPTGKNPADLLSKVEAIVNPASDVAGRNQGMDNVSPLMGSKLAVPLGRDIEESVLAQIGEKLNIAVKTGIQEIRLVLHPESLGEVRIKVQVNNDVVMTRINVDSHQVKQIVESNLQSLKSALAEHNLQAGGFEVNVGHGSTQQGWGESRHAGMHRVDGHAAPSDHADVGERDETAGHDTGRRYGSNSIEYFA